MTRQTREELLAALLAERYGPMDLILAEGGPEGRRSACERARRGIGTLSDRARSLTTTNANGPARSRQEAPTRSIRLPVKR